MKNLWLTVIIVLACSTAFPQKENSLLRQGNRSYDKGEFKEAEKDYRKAFGVNPRSEKGRFNLGTAVYKNNNYEEAAKIFGELGAADATGASTRAQALHNLGNSYLQAKDYEKSIDAYKRSLLSDPKSIDTKYNLEYAKMMLKKQQQQQQQQQQNKDQQDKKDEKEDKKDQQQNQDQKQDQQKQPQDQKKISKEDAERMLEALKNDEKKTMDKVKKQKAKVRVVGIEKDW